MRRRLLLTLLAVGFLGCRTVIISPAPQQRPPDERPAPSTAVTLGIPPGHLPRPGECKIWIPGTPPGRQPYRRSRPCAGIAQVAPPGSWIVYRPTRDKRHVYVRHVDQRRAGVIILVRMFEWESGRYVRDARPDEVPDDDDRPRNDRPSDDRPKPDRPLPRPRQDPAIQRPPEQPPDDRPAVQRPPEKPPEERPAIQRPVEKPPENKPAENKPPENKPRDERPQGERPELRPRDNRPGARPPERLDVPPGHLPDPGQCRVWILGTPPGQQRNQPSGDCNAVTRSAPAGSWVVYQPSGDRKLVHVRVVDDRLPGVIVAVWVFDGGSFVREEKP
ncbi:MAG TPA: hypothetical protein VGA20_01890 [Gemmatimonadales bacterium]